MLWDGIDGVDLHVAVAAASAALRSRCAKAAAAAIAERRSATAAKFSSGPGASTACFRALRKPMAAGLVYLRDDSGTYTAEAGVVDQIARRAWGEIYRGTDGTDVQVLAAFRAKFDHLTFRAPEVHLPPIDPERFHWCAVRGSRTAGGIDNWARGEWAYLPKRATALLARLLN